MRVPEKSELPLKADPEVVMIDDALLAKYHRAFRDTKNYTPPTVSSLVMTGLFSLVDELKVNWKHLLHTAQDYEYFKPLQPPEKVWAQTSLEEVRQRRNIVFLQFQTLIRRAQTNETLLICRSTILIQEPQEV